MAAFSLLEIVFVLGAAATIGGVAVPETLVMLDDTRTAAAARYVATRLQQTRIEAVVRNTSTALRFTQVGEKYDFTPYVDGNRNGVLSRDIQSGADPPIRLADRLTDHFPGVDFGAIPGLPPVDPSSTAPGSDPIRLGSSDMVTFTATGTATAGSVYIAGRRSTQYVVRIYGETGKTRVLKFNSQSGLWTSVSDS